MSLEGSHDKVFALFKHLPPEIRCHIWMYALPEARVVAIWYDPKTTSYRPRIRPPGVLQATQESRHEALKVYHELRLGLVANTGCYINPEIDSIYLRSNLTRISNRIDDATANIQPWQRGRLITTFPSLEELSFTSTQNTQTHQTGAPSSVQETGTDQTAQITPKDQAGASDPSDVEASNSMPPPPGPQNPDMLRSRRHSKIILQDLIQSPDVEMLFRSFHVNYSTWDLIRRYYRHRRHKITVRLKELCVVFEKGSGPLKSGFKMQEIGTQESVPEGSPLRTEDYEDKQKAYKVVCSLKASNSFVNWRDRKAGRPVTLFYQICAKSINLGERRESARGTVSGT